MVAKLILVLSIAVIACSAAPLEEKRSFKDDLENMLKAEAGKLLGGLAQQVGNALTQELGKFVSKRNDMKDALKQIGEQQILNIANTVTTQLTNKVTSELTDLISGMFNGKRSEMDKRSLWSKIKGVVEKAVKGAAIGALEKYVAGQGIASVAALLGKREETRSFKDDLKQIGEQQILNIANTVTSQLTNKVTSELTDLISGMFNGKRSEMDKRSLWSKIKGVVEKAVKGAAIGALEKYVAGQGIASVAALLGKREETRSFKDDLENMLKAEAGKLLGGLAQQVGNALTQQLGKFVSKRNDMKDALKQIGEQQILNIANTVTTQLTNKVTSELTDLISGMFNGKRSEMDKRSLWSKIKGVVEKAVKGAAIGALEKYVAGQGIASVAALLGKREETRSFKDDLENMLKAEAGKLLGGLAQQVGNALTQQLGKFVSKRNDIKDALKQIGEQQILNIANTVTNQLTNKVTNELTHLISGMFNGKRSELDRRSLWSKIKGVVQKAVTGAAIGALEKYVAGQGIASVAALLGKRDLETRNIKDILNELKGTAEQLLSTLAAKFVKEKLPTILGSLVSSLGKRSDWGELGRELLKEIKEQIIKDI